MGALGRKLALHQMNLAHNQFIGLRDGGALYQFANAACNLSLRPDTTDGQVRLEDSFFVVIAETLHFPLDLLLESSQRVQLALDSNPYHSRIFRVRKTADVFQAELKRPNSGRRAIQSSGEIGQAFVGNVAEKSEREMELFGAGPTHGILRETLLKLALNLFEFDDPCGFQCNRDEGPDELWCGRGHGQWIRRVPAG